MSSKNNYDIFDKIPESDEEFKKMIEEFIAQQNDVPVSESNMDAYDYLAMAAAQPTAAAALKIAKKALELEPNNIDAQLAVAQLSAGSNETLLKKLKKLITEADKKLHAGGWFDDEYIGYFDSITETKPYTRLRTVYINTLITSAMFKTAIEECKSLLHLAHSDSNGVRYILMHLYALFEDELSAIRLLNEYDEHSTMFLLPLSILYYRLGDYKNAEKYLNELNDYNPDTSEFLQLLMDGYIVDLINEANLLSYSPGTIEEFKVELYENQFLFITSQFYFVWATKKLKKSKKQ